MTDTKRHKPLLCRLGFHRWSEWERFDPHPPESGFYRYMKRQCKVCRLWEDAYERPYP